MILNADQVMRKQKKEKLTGQEGVRQNGEKEVSDLGWKPEQGAGVGRVLVEECGGSEVLQHEAPVCPVGALTMSCLTPQSHGHNAPLPLFTRPTQIPLAVRASLKLLHVYLIFSRN